jgi:hypothetical protein
MGETCATCKDLGYTYIQSPTHPALSSPWPCKTCRRIVSVEDAVLAETVREIEKAWNVVLYFWIPFTVALGLVDLWLVLTGRAAFPW